MADALKAKGNAAFSAGNYEEAIEHFTSAIAVDPQNHVLFSNRSASHASLKNYDEALTDAKKCVELKPDWPKGYSRLGAAYHGMEQWEDAIGAYEEGLKLDPSNQQLQKALSEAQQAQTAAPKSPFASKAFLNRLASDPRTRGFLSQPDFLAMLGDLGRNPNNINMYLRDPRFNLAMSVGLGLEFSGDTSPAPSASPSEEQQEEPASSSREAPSSSSAGTTKATVVEEEEDVPEVEMTEEEKEQQAAKEQALAEKEKGNEAYKKREFEKAVEHYNKALELYDQDISFITNRAAVYFEMKKYEDCIADCDTAVEKGREMRADYKIIAKALTRKGNALAKMERHEDAIAVYNKSLMEHRNADTLKRLQEVEKALKEKTVKAYIDLDVAAKEKDLGNAAFKEQRYPDAVKHYEEALKRGPPAVNPEAHKVYSNLAACFTKLGALNDGLKAAEMCIQLQPGFAKGYSRKGSIQYFMKEYDKALETYEKGLEVEPDNEELKAGMKGCMEAIHRLSTGQASEEEVKERQAKAMADPEVQRILTDPVMRQVLQDLQENPRTSQQHLRHPEIAAKIQKLVAAGMIQMK